MTLDIGFSEDHRRRRTKAGGKKDSNIKPSELPHANKSLSAAVRLPQLAGLISQRRMAAVGVTRVHSASFVSASQPRQMKLQRAEVAIMIAAAELSLSSVASTTPITHFIDLNVAMIELFVFSASAISQQVVV